MKDNKWSEGNYLKRGDRAIFEDDQPAEFAGMTDRNHETVRQPVTRFYHYIKLLVISLVTKNETDL
jgi:hypothetical protein